MTPEEEKLYRSIEKNYRQHRSMVFAGLFVLVCGTIILIVDIVHSIQIGAYIVDTAGGRYEFFLNPHEFILLFGGIIVLRDAFRDKKIYFLVKNNLKEQRS